MKTKKTFFYGLITVILTAFFLPAFIGCEQPNDNNLPALTGTVAINDTTPEVGDTITATYAGGNGTGTATWQWLANDTAIPGANSSAYVVVGGDTGKTLKVRVSYSEQSGNVTSNATSAVAASTKPALTGTVTIDNTSPEVGDFLTASYTGGNGSGIATWQWLADDTPVGINSSIYIVADGNLGKALKARVSYSGQSGSVSSAATSAVTASTKQTGTLAFELITTSNAYPAGANLNTYRVRRGTVVRGPVVIPATYNELPVTEIGKLNDNDYSNTNGAFDTVNITSVSIPDSVTTIGGSAFKNCTGLTSITIPNSVTTIGGSAFNNCTGFTSVIIPNSVTSIGKYAFDRCTNLISITIPASLTFIGFSVFSDTAWYNNQPDGLIYLDKVLYGYKGTMPANTTISNIREDTIAIAGGAFYRYTGLISVTIPDSVRGIGGGAFSECTGLTGITVATNNTNYLSEGGIVYNKEKTQIEIVPTGISGSVTIPDGVTEIGSGAFDGCTSLTSVTIPASITSIGDMAFFRCTSLTSVTFAEESAITRENFGDDAFYQGGSYTVANRLRTAYLALTGGAGTYTRKTQGWEEIWSKQP